MTGGSQGRWVVAWLVLAALAFVALRAPALSMPLERDEGEYAYIAWRMLEGDVPYRDGFDQKPPGVFAAYAVALAGFGGSVEGIRLLAGAWSAVTALLLFLLVRRLAGALAGAGAALAFAAVSADPRVSGLAANTEVFLLLPLVASLLTLLRALEGGRARWWLATGALLALAGTFKQVAATQALFVALVAGLAPTGEGRSGAVWRRFGWLAAGGLAVVVPVVAAFAVAGAARDLADAVVLHNLAYAQRRSFGEGLHNLAGALAGQAPSFAVLWALALAGLWRPGRHGRRAALLLGGWLVASLAGVAVGWQFRPHYFIQALPALAAWAGLGAAGWVQAVAVRRPALAGGLAATLGIALAAAPALANRDVLAAGSPDAVARRVYGLNPFPEAREIARHIAAHSTPDETVYVVGSEPEIPFYARRRSATRYIIFYPLTGDYADAAARQAELLAEVRAARPRYVVWVNVPTSLLVSEESERGVFAGSEELLRRGHRLELLARPAPDGSGYVFERGSAAARWLAAARPAGLALPWVAVYRRIP